MRKIVVTIIILASVAVIAFATQREKSAQLVLPAKISSEDMTGNIFLRADMVAGEKHGTSTYDVSTLVSTDGKFASGVYKAGKHRLQLTAAEPYGVDEFMYMLEGTLVLRSPDGTVQEIGPGEAVTIPKEWFGVLETEGYVQLWVLYSADGSALE
jgi:uncharacterized cupin superfamily protein